MTQAEQKELRELRETKELAVGAEAAYERSIAAYTCFMAIAKAHSAIADMPAETRTVEMPIAMEALKVAAAYAKEAVVEAQEALVKARGDSK